MAGDRRPGSIDQDKVKIVLVFAEKLQQRLPSSIDTPSIDPLLRELADAIRVASGITPKLALKRRHGSQLAARGRELFNLCIAVQRIQPAGVALARNKLVLQSRYLAFLMMHLAKWTGENGNDVKPGDIVLLLSVAFKVTRLFVDDGDNDTAVIALQKAAEYTSLFPKLRAGLDPEQVEQYQRLEAEYLVLRTALALKEGRLDVAEHMYGKTELLRASLDPVAAESLAEVLFDMGKCLSGKKDFVVAAKWLDRAYEAINGPELDRLSRQAVELRFAIGRALVSALLNTKEQEDFKTASNLVGYIASEVGETPAVMVLRLEIFRKVPPAAFDDEAYATVIVGLVRSCMTTDPYFKLIEQHAWKLFEQNQDLGCSVTDEWLKTGIARSGRDDWVGRIVLRRLLMAIRQPDTISTLDSIRAILHDVCRLQGKPLKASCTAAAHTIIWKKLETLCGSAAAKPNFQWASKWTELALSEEVFREAAPINLEKFSRKRLFCAIEDNLEGDALHKALEFLKITPQTEPLTNYLIYKAGLRCDALNLVVEGLQGLAATESADPTFLYACVLDAQKAGNKVCAYRAMKALVESRTSAQIHRPALLRSAIRCLESAIKNEASSGKSQAQLVDENLVDELCRAFELVVDDIKQTPKVITGQLLYTVKELDWFCKNSYNLGISHLGAWDLAHIIRMLQVGLAIHEHYPADISAQHADDICFRSILSHFVVASAMVSVARTEDDREKQLQTYRALRLHVEAFDKELQERLFMMDELTSNDLLQKLADLLALDFEAAICLNKYGELGEIIRKAADCKSAETLKSLADCLLRGNVPPRELYPLLRRIINEIWHLERFNSARLAKYMRCLFQAVLPLESELGKQLLQEAIDKAKASAESGFSFPPDELQWLVTVAWNHAVDYWRSKHDEDCREWACLVMDLAQYATDGGQLGEQIRENYAKLGFNAT